MDHSIVSRHNLKLFLNRLTSRSALTGEEQQAILDLPCHGEQVGPNRDLVRRGDRSSHACLLVAGLVGRFGQNKEGGRQITAIHIPGDMPDLYSVVLPEVPASLQALSVVTILRIPHTAIRIVAARYPAIAEAVWRDCAVDAVILSQWVANMGRKDAKGRLAHLLCEMATRLDAAGTGQEVNFPFAVTQANLADATGMTPVHLNRTIKALRNECLADIRKSSVHVHDWTRLVAAADFDASYLARGRSPDDADDRDGQRPQAA
jgi:CRP-like cAMP-binding protein